jgi:hypothetical protein
MTVNDSGSYVEADQYLVSGLERRLFIPFVRTKNMGKAIRSIVSQHHEAYRWLRSSTSPTLTRASSGGESSVARTKEPAEAKEPVRVEWLPQLTLRVNKNLQIHVFDNSK